MSRKSLVSLHALIALALAGPAAAVQLEPTKRDTAPTEKKAPAVRPDELASMVARLGAADWQARDKALRDLIALGEAARPALREAAASRDAEVRWRATYALSLLDLTLEPIGLDAARALYSSAAKARAQRDGQDAARTLYAEVVERFPNTRWAAAARERVAALDAALQRQNPKPPTPEALAQLIAQLGAASWPERQRASCRLAELGEAARATLEAAARGADPEIAWRARSLVERLDAAQAAEKPKPAAALDPRLVVELFGETPRPKARIAAATDLDALVRALGGDDAADVARARELLLNLGRDALPSLFRGLEAADETAGVEIMDLLRQITRQDNGFDPARWLAWWRARQEQGTRQE